MILDVYIMRGKQMKSEISETFVGLRRFTAEDTVV